MMMANRVPGAAVADRQARAALAEIDAQARDDRDALTQSERHGNRPYPCP